MRIVDEVIDAFVAEWLSEHEALLFEIVALQGDDPTTPYGAALAAALEATPPGASARTRG
jgi:hypothetical protein